MGKFCESQRKNYPNQLDRDLEKAIAEYKEANFSVISKPLKRVLNF